MQTQILVYVFPAMTLILSGVFAALWWLDKSQRHVLAFCVGFGSMAAGAILNFFLLGTIGPFAVVIYHIMSMMGVIALMWGSCRRLGLQIPVLAYLATVAATSILLWLTNVTGERQAMLLAQNFNSALLIALTAQILWFAGSRNIADRFVIWTLSGLAVFGFTRPFMSLYSEQVFGPGEQGGLMLVAVHVLVLSVLTIVLGLSLAAGVLLDKQERDNQLATKDALTGLPTRGAFEKLANEMLERSAIERVPISLVVGDIDHFKRINDTFGHKAGDEVIADFGRLIVDRIRPNDVGGRVGGEEFCILAWNCDEEGAAALAERIRIAFENKPHESLPTDKVISASFGVAQFRHGANYSRSFEQADEALYRAKRSGRNQVVGSTIGHFSEKSINKAELVDSDANNGAEILSFASHK